MCYEHPITSQKILLFKFQFLIQKLEKHGFIDENHGILTINQIKDICADIFQDIDIDYCYLFGSYAKGKATEVSDVDLLISTSISGIKFYDLVEVLRESLKKKVDVLNKEQLINNPDLMNEILVDSMMFRLIQISENATKLTESFKAIHNNIPWRAIKGMRNKIVNL